LEEAMLRVISRKSKCNISAEEPDGPVITQVCGWWITPSRGRTADLLKCCRASTAAFIFPSFTEAAK
jgi:hypothetical protein